MDVGATLRRARQEKRLTLDQLSRATKISKSNLRALEEGDFEQLPAGVYTRGFIRAYAREVGLDPEETVELYTLQVEEALAQPAETALSSIGTHPPFSASNDRDTPHDAAATEPIPFRIQIEFRNLPRPAVAAAAVVVFVAIVAMLVWRGGNDREEVTTAATPQDVESAATGAGAPADVVRAADEEKAALRIELSTTGLCWVSATADRAPALTRLMHAGEHETIVAAEEFVIRIGDPSTLTMTINGAPVRTLGRPGVPVTLHVDRDNYRELLAS